MIVRVVIIVFLSVFFSTLSASVEARDELDPALELAFNIVSYHSNSQRPEISEEERLLNDIFYAYETRSLDIGNDQFKKFQAGYPFLSELILAYESIGIINKSERDLHPEYQKLLAYKQSDNVRERWGASFTLALLHIHNGENRIGEVITELEHALNQISGDADMYRFERYQTYKMLMSAFVMDYNIESAIQVGNELLTQSKHSGYEIATISTLNNLAVLKLHEGDPVTGIAVLKTADPIIDTFSTDDQTIYHFTLGWLHNQIDEYDLGELHLLRAKKLNTNKAYIPVFKLRLAEALAGQGRANESETLLAELEKDYVSAPNWPELSSKALAVHARNASTMGNTELAYKYQKQWTDYETARLEDALTKDRQKSMERLATSEQLMTSKLDVERNQRLAALAQLKSAQNHRRLISYVLLMTTIIAVILCIGYLIQRRQAAQLRVAAKELEAAAGELEIARDQALAGAKVKSNFMAMMHHEIRTPLNAIIPLSEQLGRLLKDNAAYTAMLSIISNSGHQLLTMMDNIMLIAGGKEAYIGNEVKVDFFHFTRNQLVDFAKQAKDKGLKFSVKVMPSLNREVVIDKKLFTMVLDICLSNAIKFTDKGEVKLICREDGDHPGQLIVEIKDDGPGIDEEVLRKIGDPFEAADMTRKRRSGGAGLGFATLHTLSEVSAMKYHIRSTPDNGTTVQLRLKVDDVPLELEKAA